MLRFAAMLFGFSADRTMSLAQLLFETGLITYIRTDSTRVSDMGLAVAKRLITDNFGVKYYSPRRWGTGEEGAHECIRPTRPLMVDDLREELERGEIILQERLSAEAFNLYDMIVRIFMASQMKEAWVDFVTMKVEIELEEPIDGKDRILSEVSGFYRITEAGFLRALAPSMRKFFMPRRVPLYKEGTILGPDEIDVKVVELPKAWPLNEGEIVRMMRERGIGRPSTYATIIQKLFERRYIKRQGGYILPKERGIIINMIINDLHKDMVSEERTRIIFERIDEVASRRRQYLELLREIYDELAREMEEIRGKRLSPDVISAIEKYRRDVEKRFG